MNLFYWLILLCAGIATAGAESLLNARCLSFPAQSKALWDSNSIAFAISSSGEHLQCSWHLKQRWQWSRNSPDSQRQRNPITQPFDQGSPQHQHVLLPSPIGTVYLPCSSVGNAVNPDSEASGREDGTASAKYEVSSKQSQFAYSSPQRAQRRSSTMFSGFSMAG